ncbi:MAG: hypothetical protein CVU64_17330 [Deltaproteobacteria bacterium HGW-Deltaproteobacteria-21]|nr:MAG: hypothetical protein CVU64_17330 [Deltaproteobacteria bacterium HGW-Deltaproteobacteria-21]
MTIHPISLDSPIKTKIAWARDCMHALGEFLTGDKVITSLCQELGEAIQNSHASMIHLGIVEECRECEDVRGGSCCGLGLENYYSGNLLLINLLLGVDVPEERIDPKGCFFLGDKGCRLAVRDVICINYLCEEITSRFSPEGIAELREREGIEVRLLFQLNERILGLLAEQEKTVNERRARA